MLITLQCSIFFFFFGSSYAFFAFAIPYPTASFRRHLFILLSAASGVTSILVAGKGGFLYNQIWVLTSINATLHAFAVLVFDRSVVEMQVSTPNMPPLRITTRIAFAFKKSLRIFCFWALLRAEVVFAKGVNDRLGVTAWDFSPINQGLLPYLSVEDVLFRGYDSIGWIIYTYSTLTAAHDILAVIFVSLLRWDRPSEWPPLYGRLAEVYSLRRFWGVFWHRLNLGISDAYSPFELFSPTIPKPESDNKGEEKKEIRRKTNPALRAFWVFFFSALYHAAANCAEHQRTYFSQELKFFLTNFVICFAETIVSKTIKPRGSKANPPGLAARPVGYLWVYLLFFVFVPEWRWPMVWEDLQQRMRALNQDGR